ncbi:MAG: recombinase family protein [Candidatus Izemoplasmataceae bacterium]
MQEKRIIVIEPEKPVIENNGGYPGRSHLKRVCAYARVSTDSEDQLHSFNAQKSEYKKKIEENEKWDFVGLYADEGISGTSIKKRPQFQQMIQDAKDGKIDLILTKSLSRFARNTVDTLTMVRDLRKIDVEVYFEKENIYSSDTKVDFMLTIFSSIAQEESRNISENIKWGFRKRFKEGKVHINTKRFLGYDKDKDGNIVINEDQAKTIRMIFDMYISGTSQKEIADFLTENDITNGRGEVFWRPATISTILQNEKYCGDAILQKRITIDYLTHKSIKNDGHAPKYYIMNNHPAIIHRKKFELVQELKKKRSKKQSISNYGNKYPLSGLVFCSHCGKVMNRHYYNYRKKNQRVVLSCKNRYKDAGKCDNKPIDNEALEFAVIESIKHLNLEQPKLIEDTLELVKSSLDTSHVQQEMTQLQKQINSVEKDIKDIISVNVSSMKENTDFYKDMYKEKKQLLLDLKVSMQKKKNALVDLHLHEERIQQMSSFLEGYTALNKNILLGVYKAIIALNQNEVILVMSDEQLSKQVITDNLESILALSPIKSKTVKNEGSKYAITYHVVELKGD